MTYFFTFLPKLIREGHLYLAQPPLFKITQGAKSHYALTPEEKDCIVKELSKKNQKVDISRFKGLGEMTPAQLKETTMVPGKRTLLRVIIDEETQQFCAQRVDELMGKKPELRFKFISEQTQLLGDNLQEQIDI
jgi:topoisomerase-4 subunit B